MCSEVKSSAKVPSTVVILESLGSFVKVEEFGEFPGSENYTYVVLYQVIKVFLY